MVQIDRDLLFQFSQQKHKTSLKTRLTPQLYVSTGWLYTRLIGSLRFTVGGGADHVRNVNFTLGREASYDIRVDNTEGKSGLFQAVADGLVWSWQHC
jgi:hypothetical protein